LEKKWKKSSCHYQLLEVLINDEEATLTKLNKLCGVKNNVFSRTRVPSCQNPIVSPEIDRNEEDPIEDGVGTQSKIGEIKYYRVQNTYPLFERQDIIYCFGDNSKCS
jgi:hypothetical protein